VQFARIIFIDHESTVEGLGYLFAKKKTQTAAKMEPRQPFSLKGFLDRIVEWIALDDQVCSSI